MIAGDLVEALHLRSDACVGEPILGIVVRVDDSHRQTVADVLWSTGIEKNIWINHLTIVEKRNR